MNAKISVVKVYLRALQSSLTSSCSLDADQLGLFPGEKELLESITEAITKGNVALFDKRMENLAEVLLNYYEEYRLELSDVLNQRVDQDCLTLLHKAASYKRANITW